ncbi:MAG: tRNA (N6-isopentenyl adenosine(37)-C2)-methylthiotransferase MiaB [Alphaproteobacteria bacterium]
MAKKVFIKTYGCQMNVYDSARMADVLAPLGFIPADGPEDADMVILNTCHIREKAAEKVYSELGRLRLLKDRRRAAGRDMLLAVAGCVAQAEGEEMLERAPFVDMVFGPQTYHRLPEMMARAARAAAKRRAGDDGRGGAERGVGVIDTDFPPEPKFDFLPQPGVSGPAAYLSVQEGCDKFCTFCVVPYTRGAEYSRPAADVLAEARQMVANGAREITLLGQNVNAYHGAPPRSAAHGPSEWGLGRLIREMAEIDGLDRIRYTTSHPADMDDDLIRAHGEVDRLMPFLHLPVQSGSDRVLRAMNRRYQADDFRRIAEKLRAARADMALASDFIVGFPGETRADFEDTLKLVRDVAFAQAYSFKFSPRPGTPAAAMEDQVDDDEKAARLDQLQALLNAHQAAFNAGFVGRVVPVLLDRRGRLAGQLAGRTPHMQAVHVACDDRHWGAIVPVRVESAFVNSLAGSIEDTAARETALGGGGCAEGAAA